MGGSLGHRSQTTSFSQSTLGSSSQIRANCSAICIFVVRSHQVEEAICRLCKILHAHCIVCTYPHICIARCSNLSCRCSLEALAAYAGKDSYLKLAQKSYGLQRWECSTMQSATQRRNGMAPCICMRCASTEGETPHTLQRGPQGPALTKILLFHRCHACYR